MDASGAEALLHRRLRLARDIAALQSDIESTSSARCGAEAEAARLAAVLAPLAARLDAAAGVRLPPRRAASLSSTPLAVVGADRGVALLQLRALSREEPPAAAAKAALTAYVAAARAALAAAAASAGE